MSGLALALSWLTVLPVRAGPPDARTAAAALRWAPVVGGLVGAATGAVLFGLVVGAAAVLADVLAPGAREWWLAAQQSPEPAMAIVLDRLELTPLVDLGVRLGDGTGAAVVVPLVQMSARLLGETAAVS